MKTSGTNYSVEYERSVLTEDISKLSSRMKATIRKAIEERLMLDPVGFGKPLCYSFKGHRRLRVSDYRIVYRIEPSERMVRIVAIKHRKEVYEN